MQKFIGQLASSNDAVSNSRSHRNYHQFSPSTCDVSIQNSLPIPRSRSFPKIRAKSALAEHYDSFRFHMKTLFWIFLENLRYFSPSSLYIAVCREIFFLSALFFICEMDKNICDDFSCDFHDKKEEENCL